MWSDPSAAMVGHPAAVRPRVIGLARQGAEMPGDAVRGIWPGVVGDVDTELHGRRVSANVGCRGASAAIASSVDAAVTSRDDISDDTCQNLLGLPPRLADLQRHRGTEHERWMPD